MIRKILITSSAFIFLFLLTSCGPSNIPVEWVDVTCSSGEVFVGDIVDLTTEFRPSNATDQGYTLSVDFPSVVDFIGPLQVQALTAGHAWVTITSDDGGHTNQCEIYVTTP